MDPHETFLANVKQRMADETISQRELAGRMGWAQPTVCQYLSGQSPPGLRVIQTFATALGCEVFELFLEPGTILVDTDSV